MSAVVPKPNLGDFASLAEKLKVLLKLDASGILALFPASLIEKLLRSGMGAVGKDDLQDRLIIIRTRRNGIERRLAMRASSDLPHGVLQLCDCLDTSGHLVNF